MRKEDKRYSSACLSNMHTEALQHSESEAVRYSDIGLKEPEDFEIILCIYNCSVSVASN